MGSHEHMAGTTEPRANTVLDPVCGMFVDPQKARGSVWHNGKTYYFCSPPCIERFQAEPEKFLNNPTLIQLGGISSPTPKAPQPAPVEPRQTPQADPQIAFRMGNFPDLTPKTGPNPLPKAA